jgi:hypothetical protein
MLFVGIGRCLTTRSPPRNRACDFYRTRLLGFTLWSWSLPPKYELHTLTVYGYWRDPISTSSQPLGGFPFSTSEAACSTSAPFQVGDSLSSRLCIPGAFRRLGFASWSILFPLGTSAVLTSGLLIAVRPHWGSHVPHHRAATGVGAFYTPGSGFVATFHLRCVPLRCSTDFEVKEWRHDRL